MADERVVKQFMMEYMSFQDIAGICHNLKIDYEDLRHDTKGSLALELVTYCRRHGLADQLAKQVFEWSKGRLPQ